MTVLAKVDSFSIDTSKTVGQSMTISGWSFQPQVVLFFWNGILTSGTYSKTHSTGFGVAKSSTSRFAINATARDDGLDANSDRLSTQYNTEVVRIYPSGINSTTPDGILDFENMMASGFSVVVDNQFDVSYKVTCVGIGGTDITNSYIGNKVLRTTAGSTTISGLGFQPDAIIIATNNGNINTTAGYYSRLMLGFCDGSLNQNTAVMEQTTGTYVRPIGFACSGYVISGVVGTSTRNYETITSITSDGFTMQHYGGGAASRYMQFLALKGGRYKVGHFDTRQDYNDIVETVGFRPALLLLTSVNRPGNINGVHTPNAALSIGAATSPTERIAMGVYDEYDANPAETSVTMYNDEAYVSVRHDAIQGLLDIKSIGNTSFTAVTDYIEVPSGYWINYLAIGYEEEVLPFSRVGKATVIMI